MKNFGEFIARRRVELDLSQEKVGEIAGLTKSGLSRIESGLTGDIKLQTVLGLSKALRVPIGDLIRIYQGLDATADKDSLSEEQRVGLIEAFLTFADALPPDIKKDILDQVMKDRTK